MYSRSSCPVDLRYVQNADPFRSHLTLDTDQPAAKTKNWSKEAAVYIWDNYIEYVFPFHRLLFKSSPNTDFSLPHALGFSLSDAENVILISHGSGCQTMIDLIHARS